MAGCKNHAGTTSGDGPGGGDSTNSAAVGTPGDHIRSGRVSEEKVDALASGNSDVVHRISWAALSEGAHVQPLPAFLGRYRAECERTTGDSCGTGILMADSRKIQQRRNLQICDKYFRSGYGTGLY